MGNDRLRLPGGFLWGTATSAHQVEGDNHNNDWWAFEQQPGAIWHGDRSGAACGWWREAERDFDLMRELGQNTHRLSVEWSRIEPEQDAFDPEAIARYRQMLGGLRERGIEPMVTLHHFTTPLWMARQGGWTNPLIVERFAKYARYVAEELGDLVQLWCTINEPAVYAAEAYLLGIHAPGHRSPREALAVLKNMLRGHVAAYRAVHAAQLYAEVGLVKNVRLFDPANPQAPGDRLAAWLMDRAFNEWALRALRTGRLPFAVKRDDALAHSLDFIGLNYYTRDMVAFDSRQKLLTRRFPAPGAEVSDAGREGAYGEVYPEGLYRALKKVNRYGVPIYVTEFGLPDADDDQRPRFLLTHLAQVHRAIGEGVPVRGVYHWSLTDNFEWCDGWALRFGLAAFDPQTGERRLRRSGELYAAICRENGVTPDMLEREGLS